MMGAMLLGVCLVGCGGSDVPETCRGSDSPSILLGQGVGGAFAEIQDDANVTLSSAPQGGFGVTVLVRTQGLDITEEKAVEFSLRVRVDGEPAGDFELSRLLRCQSDGSGGLLNGVVVGLDDEKYGSNDALLALDQERIELVVTAKDQEGRTAEISKPVILNVGG